MSDFGVFAHEYFFVYLWFIITTFVNVIAPLAGAVVVNPVTAFFTDPQRAIGISAFIFVFTGIHRVYLFRKEILMNPKNKDVIKMFLPFSIIGAIMGGFLISYLNIQVLAFIIVIVSLYFIYKTVVQIVGHKKEHKEPSRFGHVSVSMLSGFLQGSGMPGSDIRNNYLRTILSEVSVRAVGSVMGIANFFIAGIIIFLHNRLTHRDLIFIITIVPMLIPVQIYGKMYLDSLKDVHAKLLAISFSILGIVLLSIKYIFV